jgi:superfamily II DNA or RNA helicase
MTTELRDYQMDMLDRLEKAWRKHRSVMVQMPTGTGKTHLMAAVICEELSAKGEKKTSADAGILIVAHRRELLDQIRETIRRFGIESDRVVVTSIQKLARAEAEASLSAQHFSLVIVDEAHHTLAKTYRMLWERWPEARFLGLTATPCRLNGAPFTDLFDTLLQSYPIQTFIDQGWLSDFDYVSAAPDSTALQQVAALRKRGTDGDYQTREMATVMDVPASIEHLFRTYKQFADGRKGIVYAIDRQHAQHIAEYYHGQGVNCAVIDAKTPAWERQQTVTDYQAGLVDVLINVDIFSEGYDCPEVEFIQLARPTLSLSKYLQQVGRGMRVSPGKEAVLILDQVGLYQTFGLPTEERDWQQAFTGKLSGKGLQGTAHPVIIKDDVADEKMLVNLEMVRIRRRSESLDGLAVYLQNGKYGVMRDGKMTTQPLFERVRRCHNGQFFALATYPYAFYRNRTTVIDLQGADLMVQLYGQIELKGEFLYGQDAKGGRVLWDTIGKKYYKDKEPTFEHLGGLDMLRSEKNRREQYELRYTKGLQSFLFDKEEVLYNNYITIIRDMLIVKRNGIRIFKIFGFWGDSVLVCSNKQDQSIQVTWDGQIGRQYLLRPTGITAQPNYRSLRLRCAE